MSIPKPFPDFLAQIDREIAEQFARKKQKQAAALTNKEFIRETVKDANEMAVSYKTELQSRGIKLDIDKTETSISLVLHHGGQSKRSLGMKKKDDSDYLEIYEFFPDGSTTHKSTDGVSYGISNYSKDMFEIKIQELIVKHIKDAE